MSDHYDAKTGQFGRRATDAPVTKADLEHVVTLIQRDIKDIDMRFSLTMTHYDDVQRRIEEVAQKQYEQMGENHRAFLEQNATQHREILDVFKDKMAELVVHAEKRIDIMQEEQDRRDESQDKRIGVVELTLAEHSNDIEALKNAQAKKVLSKWEEIKGALFNAMAVGGISLILLLIAILVRWEDFINWIKGL